MCWTLGFLGVWVAVCQSVLVKVFVSVGQSPGFTGQDRELMEKSAEDLRLLLGHDA